MTKRAARGIGRLSSEFSKIFSDNLQRVGPIERVSLAVSSAFGAIKDPTQGDLVACLGEVTGSLALRKMLQEMKWGQIR